MRCGKMQITTTTRRPKPSVADTISPPRPFGNNPTTEERYLHGPSRRGGIAGAPRNASLMKPAYLIVNADDFGYFGGVSRGIVETARRGIVTATGILANAGDLEEHVRLLGEIPRLDTGVHLNLTHGDAVSDFMRARLGPWGGRFPDKVGLFRALACRSIDARVVTGEWRAQIERCLSLGLRVRFLNSHEHVHMLPSLHRVAISLAREFDIPHVRRTRAEWRGGSSPGSVIRNMLLGAIGTMHGRDSGGPAPRMLGLAESGKLSREYLQGRLRTLRGGEIYELMCHPGRLDPREPMDPRIRSYHDWESERTLLCSDDIKRSLGDLGIRLIGFRDLEVRDRHLEILERDMRE